MTMDFDTRGKRAEIVRTLTESYHNLEGSLTSQAREDVQEAIVEEIMELLGKGSDEEDS